MSVTAQAILAIPSIAQMAVAMPQVSANAEAAEELAQSNALFASKVGEWVETLSDPSTSAGHPAFNLLIFVLMAGPDAAVKSMVDLQPKKAASSRKVRDPWSTTDWAKAVSQEMANIMGQVVNDNLVNVIARAGLAKGEDGALPNTGLPEQVKTWIARYAELQLEERDDEAGGVTAELDQLTQTLFCAFAHAGGSRTRLLATDRLAKIPAIEPISGRETQPRTKSGEIPLVGIKVGFAFEGLRVVRKPKAKAEPKTAEAVTPVTTEDPEA